jgi:hypothetical protein
MDPSPSYQRYLDQLIAFGSAEHRKDALLEAKADYFQRTGEVFEDDKVFETRMALFLDYYLFDRPSRETGKTPAQELYEERLRTGPPEESVPFRGLTETVHGLFEVRKLGQESVRMRELFSAKDHDVTERRKMAGVQKGDILEARLIPFGGHLWFAAAFVFHPREAAKLILKEVKRRKKNGLGHNPRDLTWDCSRRALKTERYKQIAVEKIYDFENNPI